MNLWPLVSYQFLHLYPFRASLKVGDCAPNPCSANGEDAHDSIRVGRNTSPISMVCPKTVGEMVGVES